MPRLSFSKTIPALLLLVMLMGITRDTAAQTDNGVKLGLGAFAFSNLHLAYERTLSEDFSLEADFGLYFPIKATNRFADVEIEDNDGVKHSLTGITFDDRVVTVDQMNLGGYYIGLTARYYPGEKYAGSGFYLGPYIVHHSLGSTKLEAHDEKDFEYDGNFKFKNTNVGLELGVQWRVGEKENFIIDWTIAGAGVGFAKFTGDYSSTDTSIDFEEQAADAQEWFSDLGDYFDDRVEATARDNGLDAELKGFILPSFRFGLSLGYAF